MCNGIAVRLGPKISETVKGKLSLGDRILQLGGAKKVFKQLFGVGEGERLLKASQCYLSTTAGPILGLLFISNQRVSFCSERSIKFYSPNGELVRFHYKVSFSHNSLSLSLSHTHTHIILSLSHTHTHIILSLSLSLPISKRKSCFVQVSIPLRKVKRVDPSENMKDPSQKYMEIVTVDNFDFWFMGFLNYQKSFNLE